MLRYKRRKGSKNKYWLVRGVYYFSHDSKDHKLSILNPLSTKREDKIEAEKWVEANLIQPFKDRIINGLSIVKNKTYDQMFQFKQDSDKPFSDKFVKESNRISKIIGSKNVRDITNEAIRNTIKKIHPLEKYLVWIKEDGVFIQKQIEKVSYRDLSKVYIADNTITKEAFLPRSFAFKSKFAKALLVRNSTSQLASQKEVLNLRKFRSGKLNTRNHTISIIASIVHLGHEEGYCNYLKVPKYSLFDSQPIVFDNEEVQLFIDNSTIPDIKLLFVFCLYTGARLQEALNQTWENIDLDNNSISIYEDKDNKYRTITLHPTLKELLLRINNKEETLFIWKKHDDHKNTHLSLYANWHHTLDKSGISHDKIVHQCRATYITWNRKYNNFDKIGLKQLSGHKSDSSIDHYAAVLPDEITKAINNLPKMLV
jgi:integrase